MTVDDVVNEFHDSFFTLVEVAGFEPACNRLSFLRCIRVREYTSCLFWERDSNHAFDDPKSSVLPLDDPKVNYISNYRFTTCKVCFSQSSWNLSQRSDSNR